MQPLWSPCSSSPLFFLHGMFFLHYFPPASCCLCLNPLHLSLFFAPTTFKVSYFLSSLSTGPLLLLSSSTLFLRSPLPFFMSTSRLTNPLPPDACGLGKCQHHQGLLPALCTLFLPCKTGCSGRIGSTVDKEPKSQWGTNQQAGVQPVRVCRGLN